MMISDKKSCFCWVFILLTLVSAPLKGDASTAPRIQDYSNYVLLQGGKSFADQVSRQNTVYEVRDDFILPSDRVIIMPENCVLRFSGGKLINGTLSFGNTQVEANSETVFQTVKIQDCTSQQRVNASWFGLSSSNSSNTSVLQGIIDNFSHVYISPGEYKMNGRIHIKKSSRIVDIECEKSEQGRSLTNLVFPSSDGFLIEKRVILTGVSVSGNRGQWDSRTLQYSGGYVGFDLRRACVMSYLTIRGFAIGIETSFGESTSGRYERIVFDKCGNYGFRFVSDQAGGASNNANLINDCYFVNIGHEGLTQGTKSTGKSSGIGLYVRGGSGNTITHNVFEYCSGIGLFVDRPTKTSVMRGCVIVGNYFEYNKYANLYVDISTSNSSLIKNFICQGNTYSDSNLKLAPDACPNRTCSILDLYGLVYKNHFTIENVDWTIGQRLCGSKLLTMDLLKEYNSEWELYDHVNQCVRLQYGTSSSDVQFLRANYDQGLYKVEVNAKYNGNSDNRVLVIRLDIGSDKVNSNGVIAKKNHFDSFVFKQIITIPQDKTNIMVDGLYISSSKKGDLMDIKSIALIPVTSVTTLERNSLIVKAGFSIYDSSLEKMVLYNGKKWVNLDGTSL